MQRMLKWVNICDYVLDINIILQFQEKAKTYVDKALAIEPNNQYAMLVKGEILLKCKKLEEAVKFLCKCVENHSNSQMHSLLGNCYHELGNYAKAMNHHTVALR